MDTQAEHSDESPVPIVSFLGPYSSYSHQVYTLYQRTMPVWAFGLTDYDLTKAAMQAFEADRYDYKAARTIKDVFLDVQSGEAALGVVPFENSTNGAVIFTLDILADRLKSFTGITICGEAYLDVSHYLLGHKPPKAAITDSPEMSGACTPTKSVPSPGKPRTAPLCSLKHIQRIYTHPQAFGQCEIFLGTYLKGIERIDVSSTSRAAEIVKEDTTHTSAAIASKVAAEVQSLHIMARGIEDRADNKTRFFIIRKGVDDTARTTTTAKTKSLITFTVDHRQPGALASVLVCFQHNGINLTSINSRPTRVVPFQYVFFVEFEGSRLNDPSGQVKNALDAIEKYVQDWRWLGSWEDRIAIGDLVEQVAEGSIEVEI